VIDIVTDPALQFAQELALWRGPKAKETPQTQAAHRLAAAHAIAAQARLVPGAAAVPDWLHRLIDAARSEQMPPDLTAAFAGLDLTDSDVPAIWQSFLRLRPLAEPAASLMLRDSDSRLDLDPVSGLNRYGCGPLPQSELVSFSSSTATTISPDGLRAAELLRQRLISAACDASLAAAEIKRDILAAMGLNDLAGLVPVLASSGTTATLLATHIGLRGDGPVQVLLLGPEETGSGVPHVAAVRHPAPRSPTGAVVVEGQPIRGMPSDRLQVEGVPIRDADGLPLTSAVVAEGLAVRIETARAAGKRVVLHVLEGSKTGLVTPGLKAVLALRQRFPQGLDVIVDACQMRARPSDLRRYLDAGCLVVATGSKFMAGPAFCGLLLIPAALAEAVPPLPEGLADYSWRGDWPEDWERVCATLPRSANPGLLLRWRAALVEMTAFAQLAPEAIADALSRFAQALRDAIGEDGDLRLLPGNPAGGSIHTLAVAAPAGGWMDMAALRVVYTELARNRCLIGQPVACAPGHAGLRISASAPLIRAMVHGHGPEAELRMVIGKVRAIVRELVGV
jgi:hypothetical protein